MVASRLFAYVIPLILALPAAAQAQRLFEVDPDYVFQTEDNKGKLLTCAFIENKEEWLPGKLVHETFFKLERRPKSRKALALFKERLALCEDGPPDEGDDELDIDPGDDLNPPPSTEPELSDLATIARVKPGTQAPVALATLADAQLERGLRAAWEASRQAKAPTSTGTLTQTAAAPPAYQYSALPADRLRVVQLDGTKLEYFFQQSSGDFSVDAISFLSGDFHVALRAVVVGTSDLQIERAYKDGVRAGRIAGTYMYGGSRLTGEIIETGTYSYSPGPDGVTRQDRSTYSGLISGENITVNVAETIESSSIGGRQRYAWRNWGEVHRHISSTWTVDGLTFSLHDTVIHSSFLNGVPAYTNSPAKWFAEGQLRVNDLLAGFLVMSFEPRSISAMVVLAQGAVEAQRWGR